MDVHDIQGVVWIWWFGMPWEKFVSWKICMYWRGLVIQTWSQSWSNFENIDRNSCSNLGRFVIKEEDSLSDPRFPTIFHCLTRCLLFCWFRDHVGRWLRGSGVGPKRKGRSEGRPSGYRCGFLSPLREKSSNEFSDIIVGPKDKTYIWVLVWWKTKNEIWEIYAPRMYTLGCSGNWNT